MHIWNNLRKIDYWLLTQLEFLLRLALQYTTKFLSEKIIFLIFLYTLRISKQILLFIYNIYNFMV